MLCGKDDGDRLSAQHQLAIAIRSLKIVVEEHSDGYIAYPLDLKGVVVGEGDTCEEVLANVRSAIRFHIETFGRDVLETESPVLEAFVADLKAYDQT